MGKTPTGKTGSLEYDGAAPVVFPFSLQAGATTASAASNEFIAPYDFKIKDLLWNLSDALAATTAIVSFRRNGTVIASKQTNGLATGLVDVKSGSTTTFAGTDYLIRRGDRLKFTIPAVASFGGQGVMVGNPL